MTFRAFSAVAVVGLVLGFAAPPAFAEDPAPTADPPSTETSTETPAAVQAPAPDSVLSPSDRGQWMVKVARMEGATVDIEEAAAAVAATAQAIADSGRVQDVALLSGQAAQLQRKVFSARLAAEVLAEAPKQP